MTDKFKKLGTIGLVLVLLVLTLPKTASAAVTVTSPGVIADAANTTHDFSVTITSSTNYVIARLALNGTPASFAIKFDPAGINVDMTEASGAGFFSISGGGGVHADYIIRTSGRGLSAGTYTIRVTSANSLAANLAPMIIDNADTSGAGPEGVIDYDREGVGGNGEPAGLTLTAGTGTLLTSFFTVRDTRTESLAGDLSTNLYRDITSGASIAVAIQRGDYGTSDASTVTSTYSGLGAPENTGFLSGAFTFAPAPSVVARPIRFRIFLGRMLLRARMIIR